MFLIPLIVKCKLVTGSDFLMTANLKFVEMRKMALGADMRQKMGGIAEVRSLGTYEARKQLRRHSADFQHSQQQVESEEAASMRSACGLHCTVLDQRPKP